MQVRFRQRQQDASNMKSAFLIDKTPLMPHGIEFQEMTSPSDTGHSKLIDGMINGIDDGHDCQVYQVKTKNFKYSVFDQSSILLTSWIAKKLRNSSNYFYLFPSSFHQFEGLQKLCLEKFIMAQLINMMILLELIRNSENKV